MSTPASDAAGRVTADQARLQHERWPHSLRLLRPCGVAEQTVALFVRPAVFDGDVAADVVPALAQTRSQCFRQMGVPFCARAAKKSDHRHRRLLCARRERPRGCCAPEKRDELAPPHGLPSSEGRILPHRYAKTLLCITAKLIGEWQRMGWTGRAPAPNGSQSWFGAFEEHGGRIAMHYLEAKTQPFLEAVLTN